MFCHFGLRVLEFLYYLGLMGSELWTFGFGGLGFWFRVEGGRV